MIGSPLSDLHASWPEPQAGFAIAEDRADRNWYAVFTVPQNEKSATRHLALRGVESFLPTYRASRVWKNRQRVTLDLPLFPSYLFVRIGSRDRRKVLESPGVLRIVGNSRGPIPVPEPAVEFLRADFCSRGVAPYFGMAVGQRVRIKRGAFEGLEGTLVRTNRNLRFVLTIDLINQQAAVEVDAESLEAVD